MDEIARDDCVECLGIFSCDVSHDYLVQPCAERDGCACRRKANPRLDDCSAKLHRMDCSFSDDCLVSAWRKKVVMAKKTMEPFLWSLFSGGGVIAAMLIPVLFVLFFFAFPLGWLEQPNFYNLLNLVKNPIVRLLLFAVCSLPLFHWAHRFRFTLYDGLQIKHLNELIAVLCYGGAIIGTIVAAYLLLTI